MFNIFTSFFFFSSYRVIHCRCIVLFMFQVIGSHLLQIILSAAVLALDIVWIIIAWKTEYGRTALMFILVAIGINIILTIGLMFKSKRNLGAIDNFLYNIIFHVCWLIPDCIVLLPWKRYKLAHSAFPSVMTREVPLIHKLLKDIPQLIIKSSYLSFHKADTVTVVSLLC